MARMCWSRVKRVPDSSSEVLLTEDAQAVDGSKAGFTTSPHEECAVEIATQLTADGGEATVLTLGDKDAAEQLRTALARGLPPGHPRGGGGPHARPGRHRPRDRRPWSRTTRCAGRTHDLVLLGSDAADSGDFQVGIRLAYELGRPVVNGATTVTVEDGPDGRVAVAVGKGPEGQETYRVPLPAVVTIREGGVEPRYPSVKGRMQAKKVQIEERTPASEPRGPQRVKLLLPPPTPSSVQILGEGAEAAPAVVDLFEQLGVLAR